MPTWGTAPAAGFEFTDHAWLSALAAALNERRAAYNANAGQSVFAVAPDPVTAGTIVQSANGGTGKHWGWQGYQQTLEDLVSHEAWVDPNNPLDASTHDGLRHITGLAALRAAAGLTGTNWRRKKPRQYGVVTDLDGNTLADGMVSLGPSASGVVTRVAGAWVSTPSASPDVLDSDAAAPDHCAPGQVQIGDYLGWHLMADLKACVDVLVWMVVVVVGVNGVTQRGQDVDALGTRDWLTIQSNAEAAWATGAAAAPVGVDFSRVTYKDDDVGYAEVYCDYGNASASPYNKSGTMSRAVDWYAFTTANSPRPGPVTYDAQGVAFLTQDQCALWHSSAVSAAGTIVSNLWDNTRPPNWVATPTSPARASRGHRATIVAVARYDCPGGFAYTAATP